MLSSPLGERHTKKKSRVVIDTGVLISAFAFDLKILTPREFIEKG